MFDHPVLRSGLLPAVTTGTRSLADALGQLDQLGILAPVLRRIQVKFGEGNLGHPGELLDRYKVWRQCMFGHVDELLEPVLDNPVR